MTAVEGNASVYQVYPVIRVIDDGRAEFLRAWGSGFEQEGAGGVGGGGGGWAGQLNLCAKIVNPLSGQI